MFYLKLKAKLLLPVSTLQYIIEGFQEVHNRGMTHMLDTVVKKLTALGISSDDIQKIVHDLSQKDLLTVSNEGALRSNRTRKTYFKEN